MKSLRKSILTLLALTLFGGAGAWAQSPTQVTQFTTDLIADWQEVGEDVTLADLQALGFVSVDANVAAAWTGAPQNDYSFLVYGFNGGNFNYIPYDDSGDAGNPSYSSFTKGYLYYMVSTGYKFFYTGAPSTAPAEIELTKSGANQWTLGQTPDYDLELQVEYYEAHALKDIPAGWTVMVNGVEQTKPYDGDSLMITETDSVTLVPAGNPRRVKSVTLVDDAPAVAVAFSKESWINASSAPANFISVSQADAIAAADAEKTQTNAPGYVCIYAYEGGQYLWVDSHGRSGADTIEYIVNAGAWDEVYDCYQADHDFNSIWFTVSQ